MEIFTIVCENVSATAHQDILAAYASTTKKLQLLGVEIGATGQTTVGNYALRIRAMAATVTAGSGGSTPTPKNVNPDGASPGFTAHANDTTQASSSTVADIVATMLNPINGYYWTPPVGVGDEPKVDVSGAFVLSLDSISGTLGLSATMWLREI